MDSNRRAYNFAGTHNTSMILHTQITMHALGLHGNLHAAFTFYTPRNEVRGGILDSACLSVRLSVCLSVR